MSKLNVDGYKGQLLEIEDGLRWVREKYLEVKDKIVEDLPMTEEDNTLHINLFDLPFLSCVMNSIVTLETLNDEIVKIVAFYGLGETNTDEDAEEENAD